MEIISWNVNGIRAAERKGELQRLVEVQRPDVLMLQETKASPDQLSPFLTANDDYQQYYHSAQKKGYSGTGIWLHRGFASELSNVEFSTEIPKVPNADEGRVSQLSFKHGKDRFELLGVYFPTVARATKPGRRSCVSTITPWST